MRNIRNNKGFTLIELMIVVVIIGILAAIAIPKFSNVGNSAKEKEAQGVVKQVYTLQETYRVRFGSFATDSANLARVGWMAPNTKHYDIAAETYTAANGYCMIPKTSEASLRAVAIDTLGMVGYGTATACPTAWTE